MDKFQNKYRISSSRLQGYDYGANGMYFVTICTKNRVQYFGKIVETGNCPSATETGNRPSLQPSTIGMIAIEYWQEIPNHYPFVEPDEFTVMPDHLHGILFFNKPDKTDWQPNNFGRQSQNLGAVIRAYKSSVKRFANENNIVFEWQARFHDRIIRNERELNNVRNYIINNPRNWLNDEFNPGR